MAYQNTAPLVMSYTSPHGSTFASAHHEIFRLDWNIGRIVKSLRDNLSTCRVYIRVYVDKDAWATMKTPLTTYHFDFSPDAGTVPKNGTIAEGYQKQAYAALKARGAANLVDENNQPINLNYSGAQDASI